MNVLYCFEYIVLICRFLSDKVFHIMYEKVEYYMITNYLIYLSTLPREKQIEQIVMILGFLFLILAISCFLIFLKFKLANKNKDSFFQRILKKI